MYYSKVKILLFIFVRMLINVLCLFIKPNKEVWLFGSWYGNRYSDNPRALYEYLTKTMHEHEVEKIVWITKSKLLRDELMELKINAVYSNSLISFYYHITAGVYIYNQSVESDFNKYFVNNAEFYNLWHGFPLKKIGQYCDNVSSDSKINSIKNNLLNKILKRKEIHVVYSDLYRELIVKSFNTEDKYVINGPYFRDGMFFNILLNDEKIIREQLLAAKAKGKKIVFYLPTFRDNKTDSFLNDSISDVDLFTKKLKDKNILLVTKFHFALGDNFSIFNRVINLESNIDINVLLDVCDLLITDYSSVYFDFLCFNRPIVFYAYDLEYYINKDRGLIFDYYDVTPGIIVFDLNNLYEAILNSLYKDYKSSERLLLKDLIYNKSFESDYNSFVKNIMMKKVLD